jgi:hypothetical protein
MSGLSQMAWSFQFDRGWCVMVSGWRVVNGDVSWEHCGRPGFWRGEDVVCSKCLEVLPDNVNGME